ncbi:MAG: NAD(P)H-hydrate dehydratase [Dechloromonas sp.]|nr:NAD(P)H-hydrate dehydratase [Dechloromonas sp.]
MMKSLYLSHSLRLIETAHRHEPLMERAGSAAAAWAAQLVSRSNRPILVLAGPGNNGGDAFEAARLLRELFFDVQVCFAGDPAKLPNDARGAHQRFVDAGEVTTDDIPTQYGWSLIIDGLFGIGLTRAPDGQYANWIATANAQARRDQCPVLALDCPSGLNADTGNCPGVAIRASHTLTFIAAKPGLLTNDGPDHCGDIRVAALDLAPTTEIAPDGCQLTVEDFADCLHPRLHNSHKGSFGSVGILGGAHSMLGAAFLAGRSAVKLGAGKVYVGLMEHQPPGFDPQQPELMFRRPQALLQSELTALACGPGMGMSLDAGELLETALGLDLPLVLDADALNLVASEESLQTALASRRTPAILTPHPTEAARLLECTTAEVQADRIAAAYEIVSRYHCHVALKGCGTVVATIGGDWWINHNGNPGMATAGTGDVLTGIITALLGQGWPAEKALLGGVHLHGAAADRLVANGLGPIGLTAGELIDAARLEFNGWVRAIGSTQGR